MKGNGSNPFFGGGFFPGQREGSKRDIDTDYKLVLHQTKGGLVNWSSIFVIALTIVRIIGPLTGYIAGVFAFGYAALVIISWTQDERQPVPTIGVLVGMFVFFLWLFVGYGIIDRYWWPVSSYEWEPRNWEIRNKVAVIVFLAGVIAWLYLNMYRFAYEVVDPNSHAPISPRPPNWGILWPGKRIPADGEVEVREVIRDVVREVPRPFQIPANGDGVAKTVTDDLDASRVDESRTVMAPSGREVNVRDLIDFVKLAPHTGATFRPWKNRGWKHRRWKDVVEVWKIYDVVEANGERSTTEIAVTDLREALTRLSSAFVEDPPTPA